MSHSLDLESAEGRPPTTTPQPDRPCHLTRSPSVSSSEDEKIAALTKNSNPSTLNDSKETHEIIVSPLVTGTEGGPEGWRTVAGGWFIMFATLGYMYSFGVFQDYYTRFLLSSHTPSAIAWIGSVQLMLPFFLGAVAGKLFDAGYFHVLQLTGAVIFTFSLFMLSLVKQQSFYQVFLSQGVCAGLGIGCLFVPTVSVVVHHFKRRKALASGIILSGGAMGSMVFPIMLNHLIPMIGFKKAVQASAYIVVGCLVIGNALVKTAYPAKSLSEKEKPDIKSFIADPPYMWAILAAVIAQFGIFFPIFYLQLFAVQHNIDPTLAFYSLSIVNFMGAVGRIAANFLADKVGPLNVIIPVTAANAAILFAIFGVKDEGTLIVFSILFGFVSGAWLSLAISTLSSLARRPDEVGARTGIGLAIGSFGALGSAPSQGALLTNDFSWSKPVIFSGVMLAASVVCATISRTLVAKERRTQKV